MRPRRCLILGALLAVAALMSACGESKPSSAAGGAAAVQASPGPPAAPPKAAAGDVFVASGPIVVENQVDVTAQREGIVTKLLVDTDAKVHKGQMLALLDDRQIAADHEAAQANVQKIQFNLKNWEADLQVLRSDFERSQKMWEAQLITKEQLEHDRYKVVADEFQVQREKQALLQAQATARSLEMELEKTRIRAPFDGVVARRYVRAGQRVAIGERIFWVTAEKPLRVKFTLPEKFLGRLKKGDEVDFTSSDAQDVKHKAKVIQISPVVDPSSGTIEVLAELVGPTGQLRPGMTAQIQVSNLR